jgi:hypothetical protein
MDGKSLQTKLGVAVLAQLIEALLQLLQRLRSTDRKIHRVRSDRTLRRNQYLCICEQQSPQQQRSIGSGVGRSNGSPQQGGRISAAWSSRIHKPTSKVVSLQTHQRMQGRLCMCFQSNKRGQTRRDACEPNNVE